MPLWALMNGAGIWALFALAYLFPPTSLSSQSTELSSEVSLLYLVYLLADSGELLAWAEVQSFSLKLPRNVCLIIFAYEK